MKRRASNFDLNVCFKRHTMEQYPQFDHNVTIFDNQMEACEYSKHNSFSRVDAMFGFVFRGVWLDSATMHANSKPRVYLRFQCSARALVTPPTAFSCLYWIDLAEATLTFVRCCTGFLSASSKHAQPRPLLSSPLL